jgi:hypothetical protein
MENKFWLENPYILINNDNYLKFFPTSNMSRVEQLNAITRLCIYYIIILLLLGKSNIYLGLPFIIIIFVIVIYLIYKNDYQGKYEDFIIRKMNKNNKEKKMYKNNDIIESGYYDFDGKLILGKKYGIDEQTLRDQKAKDFVNYDFNELLEYEKNSCRRPTKDNPFMNPPVTDFGKENIPVACNSDDEDIKKNIERNFNVDLYRDLDDLFDNKNSQRVWYTIPVTSIPNDQESFANWLYKTDYVCKSNQDACLRYEDLRFKR